MRASRVVFLLAFTVSNALAAPGAKDKPKNAPIYPTKPGTKWEYQWPKAVSLVMIKSVEAKDGVETIALSTEEDGKLVPQERLAISNKGVFRVEARGEKVEPPLCLLRLPHSNGQEWESSDDLGECKGKHKAVGPEAITVPAGKFNAIRVESEYTFRVGTGKPVRHTDWYAPGVGLVKSAYGKTVIELKKYTPAKD